MILCGWVELTAIETLSTMLSPPTESKGLLVIILITSLCSFCEVSQCLGNEGEKWPDWGYPSFKGEEESALKSLYVLTHSPLAQSSFIPPAGFGLASSRCGNELNHSANKGTPQIALCILQGEQPEVYMKPHWITQFVGGVFRGVWGPSDNEAPRPLALLSSYKLQG